MPAKLQDRMVYVDAAGDPQCVSACGAVKIPAEFDEVLTALCAYMQLALDCIQLLGGVPGPVAQAILRNIEPAQAAIDWALRNPQPAKGLVH